MVKIWIIMLEFMTGLILGFVITNLWIKYRGK